MSKSKSGKMKDDSKRELKPTLRFPEFRSNPAWEISTVGELGEVVTGSTPSTSKAEYYGGDRLFVSPADIADARFVSKTKTTLTELGFAQTRKIKPNSVLFVCIGSTIGKIVQNTEECATNQQINSVVPSDGSSNGFVYYVLRNESRRIATLAGNQAVPIINKSLFSSATIACPKKKEQQKIADCLSSLDELIAAHSRKLDALKAHKKGLMQQLFPREGETLPRLRFPEFKDEPEWEVKKAGHLFRQRKDKGEQGLPIYSVTINDGMVLRSTFDRNFYDIQEAAKNKKVCEGDIAYNMMRMWQAACGVATEDCMVSPAYVVLKPREDVCSDFFFSYFKSYQVVQLLRGYSRGLTLDRLRLYFDDFSAIPLLVPSFEEQTRIAECLSSADKPIEVVARKLDALNCHKKGLMQQLFPSVGA